MFKLKIPKNEYGLRVYCTKCKLQYYHHNIDLCGHPEYQRYKSLVSEGSKRRTKNHQTKIYDEALIAAIQYKKDVKNGVLANHSTRNDIDPDNLSITDAANLFLSYRANIDVPSHLQREISKPHFNDIKRNVQQFIDILRSNNINVETNKIDSLNDYHVGYWHEHITANYAITSHRNKLNNLKEFVSYITNEHMVKMINPFNKVKLKTAKYDTCSITKMEYEAVLEAIENKSPYQQLGGERKERKNHYRPYLINGFKLALFTGLRREELVNLTWNDLYFSKKADCLILSTENLKVQRITKEDFKKKYIPVGPDLMNLLIELGYNDLKDSNLPILYHHRNFKPKTMMDCLSKGFNHYYRQAFPDVEPKKFKILRKTYLSYLNKELGDDTMELTSHGSMKTLTTHYLDAEVVAKGLTMKIFG